MSLKSRQLGSTKAISMTGATLTLTSTPTSGSVAAPSSQVVAFLQNAKLTEWVSTGEVWRPTGINVCATTTITVTAPIITLTKAPYHATGQTFAAASSGGVATVALLVAGSAHYYAFTTYVTAANVSNFVADAAGDSWKLSVGTSPSAGAATLTMHYVNIGVAAISEAVTTL